MQKLFHGVEIGTLGPDIEQRWVLAGTGTRRLQTADAEHKRHASDTVTDIVNQAKARHPGLVIMSGMAEGFDKLLALVAIRTNVPLWCVIPNRGYGNYYWADGRSLTGRDQRSEFNRILDCAAAVTYTMELIGAKGITHNGMHANLVRNTLMVALADEFLVWDPSSEGTRHCLAIIKKAGLPHTILPA